MRGARIIAFTTNIGGLRGYNSALNCAISEFVLYLNNDIDLAPSTIAAALLRRASDPPFGAVGGKIIRTHARVLEAGCISWRDGSTQGYLRGGSPQAPEANFVRDPARVYHSGIGERALCDQIIAVSEGDAD